MATAEKFLPYRGAIRGLAASAEGVVHFATEHPEGRPAGLYRLDLDSMALAVEPLPRGGLAVAADGDRVWVAGGDGTLGRSPAAGGPIAPVGSRFDPPPKALALLADDRIAVASGSSVVLLGRKDGREVQTLDLPDPVTVLAADPTGRWLAAGTGSGVVAVFEAEGPGDFLPGGSARLHEGAVSAILFEPDDLRFFSAGADLKLLTTHARGRLEPEDKGRGNNHTDRVEAMLWGPGDRLITASRDATIKSWPRVGAVKPATTRDGAGRAVGLALATVGSRARLVEACDDNTLRVFPIDAAGKVEDPTARVGDAFAAARHEFDRADATGREALLRELAGFGDADSVNLIAARVNSDGDPGLRRLAAKLLGESAHPRAASQLEALLGHPDEAVRVAVFAGLRRHRGDRDLGPIDLALKAKHADIGRLAVAALAPLAAEDEEALARLTSAIDHPTAEVRLAAAEALETAHEPGSPEANIRALGSRHADVRRAALVRLDRRGLLADPSARSAVRRSTEDTDAEVRRVAFLLATRARPNLVAALRAADPEFDRQINELEGTKGASPAPAPGRTPALDDADREPLLLAASSRALDTSLRGGRGLAALGDPRAFGLLLQLSREDDRAARAEVCRALGTLDDPRAVERLRSLLHDDAAEVRDAAFSALARIHQADPLLAAESGLDASHEDVRRRGLQALVAAARSAGLGDRARAGLLRALNDDVASVRSEAFKAALALKVDGAGAGPLRFARRSLHADIRRAALTEAMAQVGEPWGLDLILESFDDPDPAARAEAFAFAGKRTKGLEILEAALGSRFPDLRLKAVEGLVRKGTAAAQKIIARALGDEDRAIRRGALEALVDADAVPALAEALGSPHADVRLRAARALARHGDARALPPLVDLATAPEPAEGERVADWAKQVEAALDGLGELGDPAAIPPLIPPLDSPHAAVRKQAARALARLVRPEGADALRQALNHADPEVRHVVALGLACVGDPAATSLVFSPEAAKYLTPGDQIIAALGLGEPGEGRLAVLLDHGNAKARARATILLLMREWKDPRPTPTRCLALLAGREPRIRLTAARAVEALAEPEGIGPVVVEAINDRDDRPAWKIPPKVVDALAELLVHGDLPLRARTARLLRHLEKDDQDDFNLAWKNHAARFAREIAALARHRVGSTPPPAGPGREALRDLAFGAYVGLAREPGGSASSGRPERVRQTALARVLRLAETDPRADRAALPVFVQALGDPNQAVRSQAFDQALARGMPASALAAEALASGHVDLGVRGLELLAGDTSEEAGRAVLEQAMLARTDDLAGEAARLLTERIGAVAVASRALEAAHPGLRKQAVAWLAAEAGKDPAAVEKLRGALASRYGAVREAAACELASRRDPAAFEVLVRLLAAANKPPAQTRIIAALEATGDPRVAPALLDRIRDDPAGTAAATELLRAVGRARQPGTADRLLALVEEDSKRRDAAFDALVMVSGYDQIIPDRDEETPDSPEVAEQFRKQHPRHDEILARMLDRLAAPAFARHLSRLLPGARWARGPEVGPPLGRLAGHGDDDVRRVAVEALGWRLRKRSGDPEPLRRALGHPDPITQFRAAEELARAGRPDGLNVLLASLDYVDDPATRAAAVRAFGELADERAAEILVKLAGEEDHALQEPALEAIGHFARSPRAERIAQLLETHATGIHPDRAAAAIAGLRRFGSARAWEVIRDRAEHGTAPVRRAAIDALGHRDDPAARDLLLRLVATGSGEVGEAAQEAARRLFGPDSLEPDYALLANPSVPLWDPERTFGRVFAEGDPARLLDLMGRCQRAAQPALRDGLLGRADLPVKAAEAALAGSNPAVVGVAARILGRASGGKPAAKSAPAAVAKALERWRQDWIADRARRRSQPRADRRPYRVDEPDGRNPIADCLRDLIWASGRVGGGEAALAEIAASPPDGADSEAIRREAILALAGPKPSAEGIAALKRAALAGGPDLRALAAQAVARSAPAEVAGLARSLRDDADSFRRLALADPEGVAEAAREGAGQVATQGVVLTDLIRRGEVATLAAVAEDRRKPDLARLGAVEGLAAIAREEAEAVLRRVGLDEAIDEELRKAAWRGLARSKRARARANQPARASS